MNVIANPNRNRYCAFCKNWFDPTLSALTKMTSKDMYKVNSRMSKRCNVRLNDTKALQTCSSFERKV